MNEVSILTLQSLAGMLHNSSVLHGRNQVNLQDRQQESDGRRYSQAGTRNLLWHDLRRLIPDPRFQVSKWHQD